jgi:hypothetical protein
MRTNGQTYRIDKSTSDSHFSQFSEKAYILFFRLRFEFFCEVPKANQTFRWLYVTAFYGIHAAVAGLGGIMVLLSICLIIGAIKVSETFTLLSTL